MRNALLTSAAALAVLSFAPAAQAQHHAGHPAATPAKTIVETAVATPDLSTLVAAVKAAGLVDTLSGAGPFTVFAPTNAAFAKLPAGTVDTLVKPENKAQLTTVLTYHVVPGTVLASDIAAKVKASGGTATYTTVQGGTLRFAKSGDGYVVTDAKGGTARIAAADLKQSNGVAHVIDTVLMP